MTEEDTSRWFLTFKRQFLERLRAHREQGLVDQGVEAILDFINDVPCLVTTSSCEGRLSLLWSADPLDKRNAIMLGSWHDPKEAVEKLCSINVSTPHEEGVLWISLQPPIIHVRSNKINTLLTLYKIALKAGFSRNCIKVADPGFMLELKPGDKAAYYVERINCTLVGKLAGILEEYKKRLSRLESLLREQTVSC